MKLSRCQPAALAFLPARWNQICAIIRRSWVLAVFLR